MDYCGLSSTGLQNIDANELTSDNATIFSNLNVSGYSFFNNVLINNNSTLLSSLNVNGYTTLNNRTTVISSLNVSGFTTLNNDTNVNASLYVSGVNILQTLNNQSTNLSMLTSSESNTLQIVNNHTTDLSTLYNFRSDNPNALITLEDDSTVIHGILPISEIKFKNPSLIIDCFTKVDKDGKINVYHPPNILLPNRLPGFWIVHDEIESLHKQAIIDLGKFVLHDLAIEGVGALAVKANEGVAAIVLFLGFSSVDDFLTGGESGSPPAPIDITALNISLSQNKDNINSLSSASTLSINNLNSTTTSILGYINGSTAFSSLKITNLNVSGFTTLNNSATFLSSLNVSGFTTLNNATLLSSLNVSGFTTLNNATLLSSLNVSGFTKLNNSATFLSSLNVSGFTTLNNATLLSSLNVSGFTKLNNSATLLSSLNVSGLTTLQGNLDCEGGIAINGSNAFYNPNNTIDAINQSNTYINFKSGGTSDFCNIRQIGIDNAYKLAFDFHDNGNDARFCLRNINSLNAPDTVTEVFTVDNGNVSCISTLNISGFTTLSNNTTINGRLNVSGNSNFNNLVTLISSLNVSGFTKLNNTTTLLSSLNVSGHSTLRSITLNKNNVDPTGDSLNFYYNTPGAYFTDNGYSSYFSLNSNVATNTGVAVEPFIRVYNRMYKNGANTAMDLKTFGNANNSVNSDVLIRLDSGGDPTPGTNSGKITYNINGLDKHIMTSTGLGINITSTGAFALNVSGDSILSNILKVSGSTTLYNDTTLISSLNVSGFTNLNNNTSIFGTLNVSGFTTLNNTTTIFSSLNVSGFTILNNNSTLLSSMNISGFTTLNNNATLVSSLNVSGFTNLNNNTTIASSLNVSGFSILNNNTTLLSSLNISGRTILGSDIYNYSDSVLEAYRNFIIRKNVNAGDNIQLRVGSTLSSYLTLQEGYDITMSTPSAITSSSIINLISKKQIKLDAPDVYVTGSISSANIGVKTPLYFTTNRNVTIDGTTFSVYDIDLTKYTKHVLLDGYNIRQFRIRHWPADGNFELSSTNFNELYLKRYDIFMSNKNGLSIFSLSSPLENYYLRDTFGSQFLYRSSFNNLIFCSRGVAVKVYFIIEDLL